MENLIKIDEIEQKIGYIFKNKELLLTAFTHSSFAYSHEKCSNERLEFLGDSVLNFCTTQYLYKNFDFDEGTSSKIRAYLVSSDYISQYIFNNNLEKYLLCDSFNPATSKNVMCDLFESIVGAMMIDSNLETCKNFIYKSLNYSKDLIESALTKTKDYKSELQEYCQARGWSLEYVLTDKTGPAHLPNFAVQVKVNDTPLAVAKGKSKKEAENLCAQKVMQFFMD